MNDDNNIIPGSEPDSGSDPTPPDEWANSFLGQSSTQSPADPKPPNPQNSYPDVPEYASAAALSAGKNSKSKKIIILSTVVFGILGLTIVGAFAYNAFTGNSAGAGSPEGVIKNSISSLESQDLLGAARQADPAEIQPFIENYKTFMKTYKQDGNIRDEKKPLEAYKFEVEDLETKTVMYSDDVARVELLNGTITTLTDKSKLPKKIRDDAQRKEVFDIRDANEQWENGGGQDGNTAFSFYNNADWEKDDLESKHVFYIAVKRDGRWYFSTFYTMAEYFRIGGNAAGGDYERPSFDAKERIGDGSTSPELATENFIQKLVGFDTEAFIETMAPERFSIAYDYKDQLIKLDERNEDNVYLKAAKNAVKVTNLETTSIPEGSNRSFIKINAIKVAVKYSLDVKEKDKENYGFVPYAADVKASWDGKCYSYKGTYRNYQSFGNYFSAVTFPITDAAGSSYGKSDFDLEYPDLYEVEFPVKDSSGKIFPTEESLADFSTYYPLPWYGSDDSIIYDANGLEAEIEDYSGDYSFDDSYPYTDANGSEVYDEDGYRSDEEITYTYKSSTDELDEKECFTRRELSDLPDIGVVTVKEDGKYYVSPIDTLWHYIIKEFGEN